MKFKILTFFAIVVAFMACVDPYDPKLVGKDRKLVIDCSLTDKPLFVNIQLTYSAGYNSTESIFDQSPTGATVWISDEKGTKFPFVENEQNLGLYTSTKPIAGKIGQAYQLNVNLNGKQYRSKLERMLPVAPIGKITSKYERNREAKPKAIGRFELFVDTQDPAERTDYYRWSWRHYKRAILCKKQRKPSSGEVRPPMIGYPCCEECWNFTFCNACINIASDEFANGAVIARQNIGAVPYDSREPYYMVIEQQSLTKDAYNYWRIVKEQSSNSGGIFDAPPTYIRGNMANVSDANELVLGYFSVSAVSSKAFYFERNVSFEPFGRNQVNDPDQADIIDPNCFPCRETNLRTGLKPEGWYDLY
jgi:Domain of unknown function (DUF4249)